MMGARSNPGEPINWSSIRRRLAATAEDAVLTSSSEKTLPPPQEAVRPSAAPAPAEPGDPSALEILSFGLSGGSYGIEIRYVCEVAVVRSLSPLPRTPGYLLGIHDLRGQLLPLFDLRPLLGLTIAAPPVRPHAIICGEDQAEFGVFVEQPGRLQSLAPEATTALAAGGRDLPSWVRGSVSGGMVLLDGRALLNEPRFFLA